ncbi:MAG: ferrous iron transport protein B [Opitutales bacterium]|nr:ferrous iron transport protein B [Opitutales bacterium]
MAKTLNVALVGNANTGKTTLFNSLTGLRQRVGNYPGVTVSKFSGPMTLPFGEQVELVDLPGIYSLAATSLDERVVIDVLSGVMEGCPRPDAIVCVIDINNLSRNLFLATQVADLGLPMVLALNQSDLAAKDGLVVNTDLLRERLGVPVIKISARKGTGIEELKLAISDVVKNGDRMKRVEWNSATKEAITVLREELGLAEDQKVSDAELQRVIFDVASPLADRLLEKQDLERVGSALKKARACIRAVGDNPHSTEAIQRYAFIRGMLSGVTRQTKNRKSFTSILDKILLNRVFGFVIFVAIMYAVFYCLYTLSGIPMDWIEGQFGALGEWLGSLSSLEDMPIVRSLIVDGVIAGVGSVLVFLPQILILFFFLGLLESTGYMARAAFLMDKLLGWCGLNGKSFVPMLSGFACGIPGIMGARTIEDPKARLATILAVPFMSCGARMPVYVLMCAILERLTNPATAATVFVCMYLVGIVVAVPVAWIYTHLVMKSKAAPFVLEMPRYQLPRLRDVALRVWQSGVAYTKRAGTIIFAVNVIVWALLFFPYSEDEAFKDGVKEKFIAQNASELKISADDYAIIVDSAETEGAVLLASDARIDVNAFNDAVADLIGNDTEKFVADKAEELQVPAEMIVAVLEEDEEAEITLDDDAVEALAEEYEKRCEAIRESYVALNAKALNVSEDLIAAVVNREDLVAEVENRIAEECLVQSYLGRFGRFCQPVVDPCGFDWRITIGVLASFPAREGIVATLGTIFSLGNEEDEESDSLKDKMMNTVWEPGTPREGTPVFTISVLIGIMVFFALCGQCLAEIVVIARESSWKWAIIAWTQMTLLAWIAAVLIYQIGSLF